MPYEEMLRQIADTIAFDKNATSNELFYVWNSKEERASIEALENPLGIAASRNGLQTMVVGRMLAENPDYSLDDILDPGKFVEEKKKISAEVKAKYEETAKTNDKDVIDSFGNYAAAAYMQAIYAAKKYTEEHRENIKSYEDCIKPENRSFIAVTDILQDAIQHVAGSYLMPYTLAQPGMSQKQLDDIQNEFQIPTATCGSVFKGYAISLKEMANGENINYSAVQSLFGRIAQNELIKRGASNKKSVYEDINFAQKLINIKKEAADILEYSNANRLINRIMSIARSPKGSSFIAEMLLSGSFAKAFSFNKNGALEIDAESLDNQLLEYQLNNILDQAAQKNKSGVKTIIELGAIRTGTGEGIKNPETFTADVLAALDRGEKLYVNIRDENGSMQLHEITIKNSGLTLGNAVEYYSKEDKRPVRNKLEDSYRILLETGRSARDSDEYSEMMDAFENTMFMLDNSLDKREIDSAIKELKEKANAYYMAKIAQSHNSKRSARFEEATKLVYFGRTDVGSEDISKRTLALKAAKYHMEASGYQKDADTVDEDIQKLNKKLLSSRAKELLESEKFQQFYNNTKGSKLKKLMTADGSAIASVMYSQDQPQTASKVTKLSEQIKAANTVLSNSSSGNFFRVWRSEEEKAEIKDLPSVLGITHSRNGLSQIAAGRMFLAGYSMKDVLDPDKYVKEREMIAELTVRKYKALCDEEKAHSVSQKTKDSLGSFAAEAYVKSLEVSREYILQNAKNIKSFQDCLLPENRLFLASIQMYLESGQDMSKKLLREYVTDIPGMSDKKAEQLRDEQNAICNNYCIYPNLSRELDNLINNRAPNIPLILGYAGICRVAQDKGAASFLMDRRNNAASAAIDIASQVSDDDELMRIITDMSKTRPGRENLASFIASGKVNEVLFTYDENKELTFDYARCKEYLNKEAEKLQYKVELENFLTSNDWRIGNIYNKVIAGEALIADETGKSYKSLSDIVEHYSGELSSGKDLYLYTLDKNTSTYEAQKLTLSKSSDPRSLTLKPLYELPEQSSAFAYTRKKIEPQMAGIDKTLLEKYKEQIRASVREKLSKSPDIYQDYVDAIESPTEIAQRNGIIFKSDAAGLTKGILDSETEIQTEQAFYSANTVKILNYLNTRGREFADDPKALRTIFENQKTILAIVSSADGSNVNAYSNYLNSNNFKNLYGSEIKVENVSSYNNGSWFKEKMDAMASVKLIEPEKLSALNLSEQDAAMICVGEFLDRRNAQPIGDFIMNSDDKGTANSQNNDVETQYDAYLAQHLFAPVREKEWGNLLVGKESRERAKDVLDNIENDPAKAAADLERVYRKCSKYALNIGTWEKNKTHSFLAMAAYESLQNERFAPYCTLTDEERGLFDEIKGRVEIRHRASESAVKMADAFVKSKIENKTVKEDPELRSLFDTYLADAYLDEMLTKLDVKNVYYSSNHDDARCSHSYFERMLGAAPDMARSQIIQMINDDPKYAQRLNNVTIENYRKMAGDFCSSIPYSYRLITGDPETTRRMLECPEFRFEDKFKELFENSKELNDGEKQVLESAVKECEKQKYSFYNKDFHTVKDLKEFCDKTGELRSVVDKLLNNMDPARRENAKGLESMNVFLDSRIREMGEEAKFHELMDPIAGTIDKRIGYTENKYKGKMTENIEYQQQRLSIALKKQSALKKAYTNLFPNENSARAYEINTFRKVFKDLYPAYPEEKAASLDPVTLEADLKEQIRSISNSVKGACANILANTAMIKNIEANKNNLSMEQYGTKFNPEAIKKAVSDVRKSSEFKTLMNGLKPEELAKLAESSDKKNLEESVNDLHKKFIDIIHAKPGDSVKSHNTVKEKEAAIIH